VSSRNDMERPRFLNLVPSVYSQRREWTIRLVRAKDIHDVKLLNVVLSRSLLIIGSLVGRIVSKVLLFTVFVRFIG
jgi:hypothetical protein